MNIGSNLEFLKALAANNNKPWMDENKKWYEAERKKLTEFVTELLRSSSAIDPKLAGISAKECLFRINRDIRFSKDKSPYKTNFGVYLNPEGKKSIKGGYYIHIAGDGSSFVGGGIWMPDAGNLKKIRQEIDYNWDEFRSIITEKDFKRTFGDLSDDDKLSRPPKGYEADNPAVEYLKLKSFTVFRPLTEQEIASDELPGICLATFESMRPLLALLNRALD